MQLANGKVCLECREDLVRYRRGSFCEDCFRELLKRNLEDEDERHEAGRTK